MFRILSRPLSSFTYSSLISQKMYSNYIHFLLDKAKSKVEIKNLDTVKTLKDKGFIIIKNFLKEERFNQLLNEISKIDDLEEIYGEGFKFRKRQLSHFLPELFPEFNKMNEIIKEFYSFKYIPIPSINLQINECNEKISYDIKNTSENLHSDRIYSCLKYFFYLNDVGEFDFPLSICEGTSSSKMKIEFYEDALKDFKRDPGYFPFTDELKRKYDIPDPKKMCFPKNTLIIADTSALHKRGDFKIGSKRILIQGNYQNAISYKTILKNFLLG